MSSNTSTALATHAFEPSNAPEAITLAKTLVASRLLPKSVATAEAAFTIIMCGRELGLTAMQSLRSIHVIEGKPVMSADLMLALVKRSPDCEYVRLAESTADVATYEAKRKGEPSATRMSFTLEEAKAAGLVGKDNWKRYPAAMLRARCIAAIVRAVFPDVLLGVYETDELVTAVNGPGLASPAVPPPPASGPHVTVDGEILDDPKDTLCAKFASMIAGAATIVDLQAVAKDIGAAAKAGRITQAHRDALASLGKDRKAELAAATGVAVPPSAPEVGGEAAAQ